MKDKKIVLFLCFIFLASLSFSQTLIVIHAGSLTIPFRQVEKAFTQHLHRNITFDDEPAGSVKIMRMIDEMGKMADIVAVADYSLIPQFLIPKYANWYVKFATNKLVIAYTPLSKYADEINQDNWYEILLRHGVEYGFSNPNMDPCGYRTRLAFQLAEKYYNVPNLAQKLVSSCPLNNVKPKSVALIAGLESGELDYAFEYLSVAKQNKLKYVLLPDELNFGSQKYSKFYAQSTLTLSDGKKIMGKPIIYGVTILKNAPHKELAEEFLSFLLSANGRKIFKEDGQPPIIPQSDVPIDELPSKVAQVMNEYVEK